LCYSDARLLNITGKFGAIFAALLAAALASQVRPQTSGPAHTPATQQTAPSPTGSAAGQRGGTGANEATPGNLSGSATGSADCEGDSCPPPPAHITIATPAPAPAPWLWPERVSWAANLLLVVLAYVGVMLGLSTLRKIERQTRYAENAAQAAADSAKAALSYVEAHARAERPWIVVTAEPAPGQTDAFTVVATNRGRGPARVIGLAEGTLTTKDEENLPEPPVYEGSAAHAPPANMILLPGESSVIRSFRRDDLSMVCKSTEQLRRIENWEERVFLYGKVTYVDLQAPDEKMSFDTAWCCWYIHGRQKSGMVIAGSAPYNQHT
jgi:hypothetical protein